METYSMHMDWKNENSQDVNTTISNLQIQCIQYQNPNEAIFFFFAGIEKPILKLVWNLSESQIVETENTEKGRINSSFFQY